mgnify:CR=1 FL=1
MESIGPYAIESMIDTSALDVPKIALVSALTSVSPVVPFIFRNYEYSRDAPADKTRVGSCSHAIWEAVRASSAATYYLDGVYLDRRVPPFARPASPLTRATRFLSLSLSLGFKCGGRTFVDGALIANNPSLVALQEAHRIWPDEQIGFLLSVGVGSTPTTDRQEGISSYLDTGSALLESATDVEEVHRAMEVVGNLVPGLQYERLAPCDARCDMDLDCAYSNSSDSLFSTLTRRSHAPTLRSPGVDPAKWRALEAAADEYISHAGDTYHRIANALSN